MELVVDEKFNLHEGTDQAVANKGKEETIAEVEKIDPIELEEVQAQLVKSIEMVEHYYKYTNKKVAYDCLIMAERTAACLEE